MVGAAEYRSLNRQAHRSGLSAGTPQRGMTFPKSSSPADCAMALLPPRWRRGHRGECLLGPPRGGIWIKSICHVSKGVQQHQIPNPLSEARDRTRIFIDTGQIRFRCATAGTPVQSCFSSWMSESSGRKGTG